MHKAVSSMCSVCLPLSMESRTFLTLSIESSTIPLVSKAKQKNPHAVVMGRNGGMARAAALSSEDRQGIASHAAKVRWAKNVPPLGLPETTGNRAKNGKKK
jgi:hypothetical protein